MQIEVESRPSYAMATVTLNQGETFLSEAGAMVAFTQGLGLDTRFASAADPDAGFFGKLIGLVVTLFAAIVRKVMGGESMFLNEFTATQDGAQVMLAPSLVGDIVHHRLSGEQKLLVQASSFLACSPGIKQKLVFGGLEMILSKEGAFFLECSGEGDLLVNAYGGIVEVEVDGSYVVDTGHLVAYEPSLTARIRSVGGLKATMLSGEGMVLEFTGQGKIYMQTRNLGSFVSWVTPQLPA
jgi:uncharacterized protein (TIGR00266 family)